MFPFLKETNLFDQEAFDIWKQFVPEDRIILGNKIIFWNGRPCGPCSEIHIDTDEERAAVSGRSLVNADQVVEIWNNVFMEFNRKADGSLNQLNVDTGMGFERLCIMQKHFKLWYGCVYTTYPKVENYREIYT
jgi:alanyl-tRNA synthetase